MVRIEQLNVTVSVEGEASTGEAAFARLFDKFIRIHAERTRRETERAAQMANERRIFDGGGH